jgi:threonine dehydrogenase-like Zn-dependent dehydrogenase
MKAARFYGIRDLRWENIEDPVCRPGAVKVRPAFNSICGTVADRLDDRPQGESLPGSACART